MSTDTAALLQAIYLAYREKRLPDLMAHLADDFRFVVHLPKDTIAGGDKRRTKTETLALLQHLMDTYDFLAYDPGPIIAVEGRATVQPHVRFRDKKTGEVLVTKKSHAWRFREGKAAELMERPNAAQALKGVADDDT